MLGKTELLKETKTAKFENCAPFFPKSEKIGLLLIEENETRWNSKFRFKRKLVYFCCFSYSVWRIEETENKSTKKKPEKTKNIKKNRKHWKNQNMCRKTQGKTGNVEWNQNWTQWKMSFSLANESPKWNYELGQESRKLLRNLEIQSWKPKTKQTFSGSASLSRILFFFNVFFSIFILFYGIFG